MSAPSESAPQLAVRILILVGIVIAISVGQEFASQVKSVLRVAENAPIKKEKEISPLERVYYKVTRVVDGDTIHIQVDGVDETVRLLGINTPESVDPRRPVQCFGKEAGKRMKELVGGEMVAIETDPSQSTRDTYGRLLAYVYLQDGQMVNRKMIAEGYAYEYTYLSPYAYQKEFRELQTFAKSSKYGLWADGACAQK